MPFTPINNVSAAAQLTKTDNVETGRRSAKQGLVAEPASKHLGGKGRKRANAHPTHKPKRRKTASLVADGHSAALPVGAVVKPGRCGAPRTQIREQPDDDQSKLRDVATSRPQGLAASAAATVSVVAPITTMSRPTSLDVARNTDHQQHVARAARADHLAKRRALQSNTTVHHALLSSVLPSSKSDIAIHHYDSFDEYECDDDMFDSIESLPMELPLQRRRSKQATELVLPSTVTSDSIGNCLPIDDEPRILVEDDPEAWDEIGDSIEIEEDAGCNDPEMLELLENDNEAIVPERGESPPYRDRTLNMHEVDANEDYGGALLSDAERALLRSLKSTALVGPKPILRKPFQSPILDRSPIFGATSDLVLRTCFRIGEALSVGCQGVRANKSVLLELYARVTASHREQKPGRKQYLEFRDLYHDNPPHLHGTYELWDQSPLWDLDSKAFLVPAVGGTICRAMGKMKREGNTWRLEILSIWEACWEDVNEVAGIYVRDV